jgi:hypothetical protein
MAIDAFRNQRDHWNKVAAKNKELRAENAKLRAAGDKLYDPAEDALEYLLAEGENRGPVAELRIGMEAWKALRKEKT